VIVSLFPAVKDIIPDDASDLRVEYIPVDLVLAIASDILGPLCQDPAIVQLVPSNRLLCRKQVLEGFGVRFVLFVNGHILSDGL